MVAPHGSVTTEASVYVLDGHRYQRMPRHERGPRPSPLCVDDALDDGRWIEIGDLWIEPHPTVSGCHRLRLIPKQRSAGSQGVATGVILASTIASVRQLLI